MKFLSWLKEWLNKFFHKEPFVIPDKATVNAMAKTIHDKQAEKYYQRYLKYVVGEIKRLAKIGAMKAEFKVYDIPWDGMSCDGALTNSEKMAIHCKVYRTLEHDYGYTVYYESVGIGKTCVLEWRM